MRWLGIILILGFPRQAQGFLSPSGTKIAKSELGSRKRDGHEKLPTRSLHSLQMAIKEGPTSSLNLPNRSKRTRHKDAVIVGAGLAGLSVALYLSQLDPDRKITIVDKQSPDIESKKKSTIASFAAAGMLAPQSERLPRGHLLDICLASRRMYPDFCELVESMAKESGEEGAKYLINNKDDSNMDPWNVGYMASGGFLAPAFAGDTVATWAPPDGGGSATWLDEIQVRELEPNLHEDVVGGWWFPEDASVDARRLTCSLYAACVGAGVEFKCGENYEVTSLDLTDGACHGLWLKNGNYFKAKSVLVANGAWMRNLLPVPIEPHKGQSLSLVMPKDRPPILRRVLFAQDCYIVPKADGKIVIGATVEAGSFDGNVTPAGLLHILTYALQLVPGLKDLPIAETWAGLRPTTPDKGPILGKSPWKNLFLAGGYWRNGVLLAPKTAQLMACLMSDTELTQGDQELLHAFSWDRFTEKGGGAKLAANTRYAASMHPIHSRRSGTGVAAAVGTELGSYSTARKAKEERQRDRSALWYEGGDESFERAAALGTRDASAFNFGDDEEDETPPVAEVKEQEVASDLPEESSNVQSIGKEEKSSSKELVQDTSEVNNPGEPDYSEKTYDGYQAIQEANAGKSRSDELESMRKARIKNRLGQSSIDESAIGAQKVDDISKIVTEKESQSIEKEDASSTVSKPSDVTSAYQAIQKNKAKQKLSLPEHDSAEDKPDPGFRIYHIDSKTGQSREVPPYTAPGEFLQSIAAKPDDDKSSSPKSKSEDTPAVNGSAPPAEKAELNHNGINGSRSSSAAPPTSDYNEKTYDGYQDIQEANASSNRSDELEKMRQVRKKNRLGQSGIDESKLG